MLKDALLEKFEDGLLQLAEEIRAYPNENDLWRAATGIANSAGNLCLHLLGNLNHFIGATLGNTGYVRQRDLEFSSTNVPRAEMLEALEQARQMISATISSMSDSDLEQNFPLEKHGKIVKTGFMLLHLLAHLHYHIGQINYHRRLLCAK